MFTYFSLEAIGFRWLLVINGVTYLAPIFFSLWSKVPHYIPEEPIRGIKSLVDNFSEGFRYAKGHNVLIVLLFLFLAISFSSNSIQPLLIATLKTLVGADDKMVTILFVVEGVGMFLASLFGAKMVGIPE